MNYKILFSCLLVFLLAATFVSADRQVTQQFYEAVIKQDGSVQYTTTPVTNVHALGFICANSSCSAVSGSLFGGVSLNSGSSNRLTLSYPTQPLYSSGNSYGVFFSKPGYVAWEQTPTWYGTAPVSQVYTAYVGKVEMCRIAIDEFAVINDVYPNQPIMVDIGASLDATAHSPLKSNGPITYVPSQLQSNYQVHTQIKLDILDQNGNVVNTQVQDVSIDFSSSERVHFSYTPTQVGRYFARVTTTAVDSKCLSTDSQFSQKNFNVITQNPVDQCYTLLNNLATRPVDPSVNVPVTVGVDKISNYYDSNGNLFTLPTQVIFTVEKEGVVVAQQSLTTTPNANTVDSQHVAFTWTPTEGGYYTVTAAAQGLSCPYPTNNADTAFQSFYVNGSNVIPTPTNNAPVLVPLPAVTILQDSGFNDNVVLISNYAFDADGDSLTYSIMSQSNPTVTSCSIDAQNNLDCTAPVGGALGVSDVRIAISDGSLTSSQVVQVSVVANPPTSGQTCYGPNNEQIINGQSLTFFQSASAAVCVSEVRTCANGVLSGSYPFASCTPTGGPNTTQSCTGPNGATIADGSSATYFQSASAAVCSSEVRSCSNGVLSGSYQFASCTPTGGPTGNLPPVISLPDVGIQKNAGTVVVLNVTQYISDPENDQLTLSLIQQTNPSVVSCTLSTSAQLICTTNPNRIGTTQITLQVSDGTSIVSDSMLVDVFNTYANTTKTPRPNTAGLFISQFNVGDYYGSEDVPVVFNVRNEGSSKIDNVKISITSFDIDLRAVVGPFDLSAGESESRVINLPLDNVEPGLYTIRMSISSADGLERVVHRELRVQ